MPPPRARRNQVGNLEFREDLRRMRWGFGGGDDRKPIDLPAEAPNVKMAAGAHLRLARCGCQSLQETHGRY